RNIIVTTSDLSWATTCYAQTFIHSQDNTHLAEHVQRMNELEPKRGWISKNYTGDKVPQDAPLGDGRCFQLKNAMKADAARDWIETQKGLESWEKSTLI